MGHEKVKCPCPIIHNNIVTPHYFLEGTRDYMSAFFFADLFFSSYLDKIFIELLKAIEIEKKKDR